MKRTYIMRIDLIDSLNEVLNTFSGVLDKELGEAYSRGFAAAIEIVKNFRFTNNTLSDASTKELMEEINKRV